MTSSLDRLALVRIFLVVLSLVFLTGYVSVAASPIRQLTNTSATNVRPVWSPDGKRIAFQSGRDGPYQVNVMDADGNNVQVLTTGGADDRHPAWSPEGKRIAIDSGDAQRREIWIIDVASRARTQVTRLGAIATFPSWSPDGKRIAFYVYRSGVMDVWLMGADGGAPTQLTRELASERNQQCTFACHAVAWSPDGGRVSFTDGDHHHVLLMAALAGGAAPTRVSPDGEHSHFPVFLADGRLVYVTEHISQEQSYTDLWVVRAGAADREALAEKVQVQGPFAFTGDARELLFHSPRSGRFQIYAVTLDDAGKAALAERTQRAAELAPGSVAETPLSASGPALPEGWPFLVGLGAVALLLGGIELAHRMRRRSRAG